MKSFFPNILLVFLMTGLILNGFVALAGRGSLTQERNSLFEKENRSNAQLRQVISDVGKDNERLKKQLNSLEQSFQESSRVNKPALVSGENEQNKEKEKMKAEIIKAFQEGNTSRAMELLGQFVPFLSEADYPTFNQWIFQICMRNHLLEGSTNLFGVAKALQAFSLHVDHPNFTAFLKWVLKEKEGGKNELDYFKWKFQQTMNAIALFGLMSSNSDDEETFTTVLANPQVPGKESYYSYLEFRKPYLLEDPSVIRRIQEQFHNLTSETSKGPFDNTIPDALSLLETISDIMAKYPNSKFQESFLDLLNQVKSALPPPEQNPTLYARYQKLRYRYTYPTLQGVVVDVGLRTGYTVERSGGRKWDGDDQLRHLEIDPNEYRQRLHLGDVITKVDGFPVSSASAVGKIETELQSKNEADLIPIEFFREGSFYNTQILKHDVNLGWEGNNLLYNHE